MATFTATQADIVDTHSITKQAPLFPRSQDVTKSAENATPTTTADGPATEAPSNFRITLTIFQPSFINFLTSFSNGIIVVGLPAIAKDINLPRSLYLWPSSVGGLTTGSTLLIAGAVADLIGAKKVELAGTFLLGAFTLACGFSASGIQLVVLRALQGIAMAMHLPSSVAIVAGAVPSGRPRNIGFGCLGMSQCLGFSAGLVAAGVLVETIGWRFGFYVSGACLLLSAIAAIWGIPRVAPSTARDNSRSVWVKLYQEVDWVGGLIASGGLAMLAYSLAVLSADLQSIKSATTLTLLPLSIILLGIFPIWMRFRTQHEQPALIPNVFWKNVAFTSTCVAVALSYGVMNSMELFSSLYFQDVQDTSAVSTSLKLLPNLIVGAIINLTVGIFVNKVPARWLVTISSFLCSVAPLLMAVLNPSWSYWYMAFWAQMLAPMSADVLFTVGLIVVSDVFPEKSQGLAGAVYNTVSQFGLSLGTGVCQLVALAVMDSTEGRGHGDTGTPSDEDVADVLRGYRASFWTMFASMLLCVTIAVFGLRTAGTIGVKRD